MEENNKISVGNWLITFIIMVIPLVNLIMLFVWGFGSSTHPSKKTWAQAALIFYAIVFVIYLIFGSILMAAMM